jgi:hypothetical protein
VTNAFNIPKAPSWLKQLERNSKAKRGGQARATAMGGTPTPSLSNGRGVQFMKAKNEHHA